MTPNSWAKFQYLIHQFTSIFLQLNLNLIDFNWNWIELNWNSIQVALQCCSHLNFIYKWISVSCFNNIWIIFLLYKNIYFFLLFFYAFSLIANKENLLHMQHCIISLLHFAEIHLYHGYFNMSCHWHMNTLCCLIRLHVNMIILLTRLLTK